MKNKIILSAALLVVPIGIAIAFNEARLGAQSTGQARLGATSSVITTSGQQATSYTGEARLGATSANIGSKGCQGGMCTETSTHENNACLGGTCVEVKQDGPKLGATSATR